ncbi:MAG: hypothetical protein ACM339_13675 [Ignavibacteria bacterium]
MLQKFAAFILITILINACCGSKESAKIQISGDYKKIAESKLGDNYKIIFNSDSTYLTAYQLNKNSNENIRPALKFFVYDLSEEKILFEDNLPNGKVEWINDHQVKVSTTPGIVSGKEEKNKSLFGYTYDVKLKKKINQDKQIQTQ